MARSVLVDTGFVVAYLNRRDNHHSWALSQAQITPPVWLTCDAVLSEVYYLLSDRAPASVGGLLRRGGLVSAFRFAEHCVAVLELVEKYADVPMSFADACLVRMTETLDDPILLTTDSDFLIYRRRGRYIIPIAMPE